MNEEFITYRVAQRRIAEMEQKRKQYLPRIIAIAIPLGVAIGWLIAEVAK